MQPNFGMYGFGGIGAGLHLGGFNPTFSDFVLFHRPFFASQNSLVELIVEENKVTAGSTQILT